MCVPWSAEAAALHMHRGNLGAARRRGQRAAGRTCAPRVPLKICKVFAPILDATWEPMEVGTHGGGNTGTQEHRTRNGSLSTREGLLPYAKTRQRLRKG